MELIINPSVLFLDEPTTGLDASTANSVLLLLKRYCGHSHPRRDLPPLMHGTQTASPTVHVTYMKHAPFSHLTFQRPELSHGHINIWDPLKLRKMVQTPSQLVPLIPNRATLASSGCPAKGGPSSCPYTSLAIPSTGCSTASLCW